MMRTRTVNPERLVPGRRSAWGMRAALATLGVVALMSVSHAEGASTRTTTSSTNGVRTHDSFEWSQKLEVGKTLEIKGINGDIHVMLGADKAEVTAEKHAKKSDPDDVTIEVIPTKDGVTICAHYPAPYGKPENECAPGSGGHMNTSNNDVEVEFTVHVSAGVNIAARTVNGSIDADRLRSDGDFTTVNGSIDATTTGIVNATTVNGSVIAEIGRSTWTDPLELETVNGRIELTLPGKVNADVSAETVNGDISTDFPFTVSGKINRHRIHAKIGQGGGDLKLTTVNGDIDLRGKGEKH
jgi:DUF4097 and DUF4098 domain-containing protein YvlB